MSQENQYLELLIKLLDAPVKTDRTGTGTHSVFGHQMRFDLSKGFPLLTTKKVHFKSIAIELLWFLRGRTDNQWLKDRGVTNWDEWATKEQCAKFGREEGDLGPIYGHQWRNFTTVEEVIDSESDQEYGLTGFDQISWVINEIKTNPNSRRLIVSGWNPSEANQVALPPCHTLFQFYVQDIPTKERIAYANLISNFSHYKEDYLRTYPKRNPTDDEILNFYKIPKAKLSCQLYQRSADTFLGVPFNIASYALLTHLIAQECGLDVGEFIWTGGDVHLYTNHVDQAKEQLSRTTYPFPSLVLNTQNKPIYELNPEDISVDNYQHHPAIKAPVAV